MAKIKNNIEIREGDTSATKRWFDNHWRDNHGIPLHDWIVNTAENAKEIRAFACFCQPNMMEKYGKVFHFTKTPQGQMAKSMWQNIFYEILTKYGFEIHTEKPDQSNLWNEMDEKQQLGFAKAIWAKRGNGHTFETYLQEMICRIKQSPPPEALKNWLIQNNIDISGLEYHGR